MYTISSSSENSSIGVVFMHVFIDSLDLFNNKIIIEGSIYSWIPINLVDWISLAAGVLEIVDFIPLINQILELFLESLYFFYF